MIKKITLILLILFTTFGMISCGKKENSEQSKTIPENFLETVNNDEYLTENDKEKAIEIIQEYVEKEKKFINDDGEIKEENYNNYYELYKKWHEKVHVFSLDQSSFLFNSYGKLKNDDFEFYESNLNNKITDDSLLIQIEFFRNTFFLDEKELIL